VNTAAAINVKLMFCCCRFSALPAAGNAAAVQPGIRSNRRTTLAQAPSVEKRLLRVMASENNSRRFLPGSAVQ
jgi:hypothetical protein